MSFKRASSTSEFVEQAKYGVGGFILGGLLADDKMQKLQESVLQERLANTRRLKRISQGQFTAAERQSINRGAEPVLNQIQGNLAARGISQSGAGGQIIAEAAQAPFLSAQQSAARGLGSELASVQGSVDLLAAQEQVANQQLYADIGRLAGALTMLQQMGLQDPLLEEASGYIYDESAQTQFPGTV